MLHLAGGTGTKQNLKNCLPFSYCDNLRTVWLLLKLSVWCKQLTDVYQGYDCSHLALLLAQEHQGIEEELAHWLRIAAFKPILIQYA